MVTDYVRKARGRNTTDLNYAVDDDSFTCATIESTGGAPVIYIGVSSSTGIRTVVLYLAQGKSLVLVLVSVLLLAKENYYPICKNTCMVFDINNKETE